MARRASITTKHFNRVLSDADRTILACAGRGDISQGFKNALDCYAILWRLGYRPQDDLRDFLGVGEEVGLKPVVGDSGED
jgi:hypothetical protein